MQKPNIVSVFDVAEWFCERFKEKNRRLAISQLHNLVFLAQMHYVETNGSLLIPSLFVCCENGFYEVSLDVGLKQKFHLLKKQVMSVEQNKLLDLVWQKYADLTSSELKSFITSLDCWKNSYSLDKSVIVNPLIIIDSFSNQLQNNSKNSVIKPKLRISQNGPVQVLPWKPRKLNATTISTKDK